MAGAAGELEALTVLCDHLDELKRRAEAGSWSVRLDRTVASVRDGGSALRACERLGLTGDDAGDSRSPTGPWPSGLRPEDVPIGRGRYTCPRDRCERAAGRDDTGRPPFCPVFDQPMRPA